MAPRPDTESSDPDSRDPDPRDPDPRDPHEEDVERLDPDAPGRWLFEQGEDAPEPNEPA